jgi:hypothetical protein
LTDALTQVLLAKVKLNGNNEAEPHIARTSEILQQGRSMTQEILGAKPPSTVQIGRLDLNQIVRKAGRSFLTWAPENIELQLLLAPALPLVPGDRNQLERLVICLLVNMALMSDSGEYRLTVSTRQSPEESAPPDRHQTPPALGLEGDSLVFEPGSAEDSQIPSRSDSPIHNIAFRFSLTRHAVQHQQGLLSVRHLPDGEVRVAVRFPGAEVVDNAPAPDASNAQFSGVMLEMSRVPADSQQHI